jgi:hypothetical protein
VKLPPAYHLPETLFKIILIFHHHLQLTEQFAESQAAATNILKRVSVRIFKISKCFLRSKKKLEIAFSRNKAQKKI